MTQDKKPKRKLVLDNLVEIGIPNADLFDKARKRLAAIKEAIQGARNEKALVIKDLADKLVNTRGIPKREVSGLIARQLKGYVARETVSRCLGEQLKRRPRGKRVSDLSHKQEEENDSIWQIKPQEYRLEDLHNYPTELKDDIIRYQHKEIQKLREELIIKK